MSNRTSADFIRRILKDIDKLLENIDFDVRGNGRKYEPQRMMEMAFNLRKMTENIIRKQTRNNRMTTQRKKEQEQVEKRDEKRIEKRIKAERRAGRK